MWTNLMKEGDHKKFKNDKLFGRISSDRVTLKRNNKQFSNIVLDQVIKKKIIRDMKNVDKDFKERFEDIIFVGSTYKNLKIGKADEMDLDLIINLPIKYQYLETKPDEYTSGYVEIKVEKNGLNSAEEFCLKLLDDNCYLDQNKFRNWLQGVISKVLNRYQKSDNIYYIKHRRRTYIVTCKQQSSPAFTFNVKIENDNKNELSFDLVPCLLFHEVLGGGFEQSKIKEWIAIAKPLQENEIKNANLLWRASFYKDEKRIIRGHIKPVIRMVKYFRDVREWTKLRSYFIETLFMHELKKKDFKSSYLYKSRTYVFIYMIRRLFEVLDSGILLNYWHRSHNLFAQNDLEHFKNMAIELGKIIRALDESSKNNVFIVMEKYCFSPKTC